MSDWDYFDDNLLELIESIEGIDPDEIQDFVLDTDPYSYENSDEFYERFSEENSYDQEGY